MFTLKIIFVILLCIPPLILSIILLSKLVDSSIKNKESASNANKNPSKKRRR